MLCGLACSESTSYQLHHTKEGKKNKWDVKSNNLNSLLLCLFVLCHLFLYCFPTLIKKLAISFFQIPNKMLLKKSKASCFYFSISSLSSSLSLNLILLSSIVSLSLLFLVAALSPQWWQTHHVFITSSSLPESMCLIRHNHSAASSLLWVNQ